MDVCPVERILCDLHCCRVSINNEFVSVRDCCGYFSDRYTGTGLDKRPSRIDDRAEDLQLAR